MNKILLIFIIVCFKISAYGQQKFDVFASAGGLGIGAGYTVSWTIGETITETISDGNNMFTQGFQQSYTGTNSIKETLNNKEILVYPKPAKDYFIIEQNEKQLCGGTYELTDLYGRLLRKGIIENIQTKINTESLSSQIYIICLQNKEGKIVKKEKLIIGK